MSSFPKACLRGQAVVVEFLGAHYEVMIPEGYGAGMVFQTTVTLPS